MSETTNLFLVIEARTAEFQNKIRTATQRVQEMGRQMSAVGRQMSLKVTAPIVAVGTAAFRSSMQFEEAMSKIVGLVGVSRDQVEEWSKELLKLGPALGKTPQELADGLFFVTSAGFRGAEALEILEISAKASAAGLGETKTIADLVTSAVNAYGIENLDAAQATDILVAAVREGKAEAPELAAAMGQVLPIASEMGLTFDQVAAATAAMTRTGTDAATANTQLKAILTTLLKPSKQAEETLEEFGLTASGLRKQIQDEGLLAVLHNLRDRFGDNEEALASVFPNVRALAGALDLVGENAEANIETFEGVANATGSLEHAFETAEQTARQKWDKVLARLSSSSISLGEAVRDTVIPIMDRFTQVIEKVTNWFTSLDEKQRQSIIRWGLIIAAVGPVLMVMGTLVSSTTTVVGAFARLGVKIVSLGAKAGVLATGGLPAVTGAAVTMGAKLAALAGAAGPIALVGLAFAGVVWQIRDFQKKAEWSLRTHERAVAETMGEIRGSYESTYRTILEDQIATQIEMVSQQIAHLEEMEELTEDETAKLEVLYKRREAIIAKQERTRRLNELESERAFQTEIAEATKDGHENVIDAFHDFKEEKLGALRGSYSDELDALQERYIEEGNMTDEEYLAQVEKLEDHYRDDLIPTMHREMGEYMSQFADELEALGLVYDKGLGALVKVDEASWRERHEKNKEEFEEMREQFGILSRSTVQSYRKGIDTEAPEVDAATRRMLGRTRGILEDEDWQPSGEDLVASFAKGMRVKRGSVIETARNIADAARNYFPFSPAKEGPLKEPPDWASYLTHGMEKAKEALAVELGSLDIQPLVTVASEQFSGGKSEEPRFSGPMIGSVSINSDRPTRVAAEYESLQRKLAVEWGLA